MSSEQVPREHAGDKKEPEAKASDKKGSGEARERDRLRVGERESYIFLYYVL